MFLFNKLNKNSYIHLTRCINSNHVIKYIYEEKEAKKKEERERRRKEGRADGRWRGREDGLHFKNSCALSIGKEFVITDQGPHCVAGDIIKTC